MSNRQLPGNLNNSFNRVEVKVGFEYTFNAQVLQNCVKSYDLNIVSYDDNVNPAELSIKGVSDSGEHDVVGYISHTDYTYTFS